MSFDLDDDSLLAQFEDTSLPFSKWKHATHLRVIYLYLSRHPFDEALARMRHGVKRYNAAHAVPEGPLMGYHETVTVAWTRIVAATIRTQGPAADSRAFCEAQPQLGSKKLLRLFYTPARITSPEAKTGFVEPDISPLP